MAKIVCMLAFLVLINASSISLVPQDATAFCGGFIQGLQIDPTVQSKCAADFESLGQSVTKIAEDAIAVINKAGDFVTLVTDVQDLLQNSPALSPDCDLSTLFVTLSKVLGPDGYAVLMKNYFKNIRPVSVAMQGFNTCGTEYASCGLYAGEIFRYLVGFSLHAENPLTMTMNGYGDLLVGLLKGLQSNPAEESQCMSDFVQVASVIDTLGADLEAFMSGKSGAFIKLITDLNGVKMQIPNFVEECNIVGLADQLQVLAGPNGMMTLWMNYARNQAALNQDLATFAVCEKDYMACGEALGSAFQLMVGWSI